MVSTITLRSTSREEDAALAALADLAQAVVDWESCRVVGGHMVTIHMALTGTDARHRPTADADLAASVAVLGEPEFAERLKAIGYEKVDGSRLSRATEHGEAFIDLIAPAPASRALHNQPAGQFRVDKFPGIQYALNQPAVVVDVEAVPLEGQHYDPYRVAVPTLAAAIVIKSLAARTRQRTRTTSSGSLPSPMTPASPYPDRHTPISTLDAPPSTSRAPSCPVPHRTHGRSWTGQFRVRPSVRRSPTFDASLAPTTMRYTTLSPVGSDKVSDTTTAGAIQDTDQPNAAG